MQNFSQVYLQSRTISASNGGIVLDAPPHPDRDLCAAYAITVEATLTDPGGAPKGPDWTIAAILMASGWLDALFTFVAVNAPRLGGDLVESNVTGKDLAFLFEAMFGRDIYRSADVTTGIAGAARTVSLELLIPFFDPESSDPTWASKPNALLKGDVTLKLTSGVLTSAVNGSGGGGAGGTGTLSGVTAFWSALVAPGSGNEVPMLTKIQKTAFSSDTVDLGPGFPMQVLDVRAPEGGAINDYTVWIDSEVIHQQIRPRQLLANYVASMVPAADAEFTNFTPLIWNKTNGDPSKTKRAERNVSIKLNGSSSATVLRRFLHPPTGAVENRVAAQLGLANVGTAGVISLPKAPSGQGITHVDAKTASGGPRVVMQIKSSGVIDPPDAVQANRPKVPAIPSQITDTGGLAKLLNKGLGRFKSETFNPFMRR